MNSKPQTKVSKQVSLSVDEDISVDCEHLSMFEKQEQLFLMQYKSAEQEWEQEDIVFKQFQRFSFDTHLQSLCATKSEWVQKQKNVLNEKKILEEKMEALTSNSEFWEQYQIRSSEQSTPSFSVVERLTGFKSKYFQYKECLDDLNVLVPLLRSLEEQKNKKHKQLKALSKCEKSNTAFANFIKAVKSEQNTSVDPTTSSNTIPSGKSGSSSVLSEIKGFLKLNLLALQPEKYSMYVKILQENFDRLQKEYLALCCEHLKNEKRYSNAMKIKNECENSSLFMNFYSKKGATLVSFTAKDYLNGFRKNTQEYISLVNETKTLDLVVNKFNQEIEKIENDIRSRKERLEASYKDLIDEHRVKVEKLFNEKEQLLELYNTHKNSKPEHTQSHTTRFKI